MGEVIKSVVKGLPVYQYIILAICAGLLIAGFVVPPRGQVDPSVLKGIGLLLLGGWGFSFSVNLPEYIKAGASVKFSHGETSIEATGSHNNE